METVISPPLERAWTEDQMSDDTNDQTAGQPKAWESDTGHDAAVPEDPAQAIALPAVTPPAPPANEVPAPPAPTPAAPFAAAPQQPQPETTPPQGTPQSAAYAMGALGGNPALGATPGAAPSDPGTWSWPTQSAPQPGQAGTPGTKAGSHKVRTGVLIGGAAAVLLAAGIGIGHAAWSGNDTNLSALSSGNSFQVPSHSGSGNGSGNGSGSGNANSGNNPFGNFPGFNGGSSGSSGNSGSGNSNSGSSGPSDVNAIASKVDPGLVDINTTLGYQQEQAAGTGIVLSSGGVILTNNHVIDGATTISVTDIGNGKTYTASVVGYDRTKDIAVLQLHNASGLTTANLADSSTASVGQQVVGVGNAGGTGGTPSAAGGTVTALNQSITASDEGDGTSEQLSGLIETNANIQPGDSGGALVNTSGQVLGVDTAASAGFSFQSNDQSSGTQGFAIPINTALSIARQIVAGNASSTIHIGTTAFLGVEVSPAGSSSSGSGGSGDNGFGGFGGLFGGNSGSTGNTGNSGGGSSSTGGAQIAGVVTNGPAQEGGLAEGDIITGVNGKTINSVNDLTNDLSAFHPGDKVSIAWTDSSGQTHTSSVQLSSGPPQ
jgi:S1-C subfamily serine protease